ncbi:MAG: (2Fe-2S)-binding protein [Campylobacterota bacterium]|nr:(2Fe-2S)-binding protein [Campylobacterota bacterium]
MADFSYSFKVCTCRDVTLGEIIHSIKDQGANSIESIGDITDAGTACGCCKSKEDDFGDPKMKLYLSQILSKFSK